MARFPQNEATVLELAQEMQIGLSGSSAVYPAPPIDPTELDTLITTALNSKNSVSVAQTSAKEAVTAKNTALEALVEAMKRDITYAEYVVGDDNDKLQLIGWGVKKPAEPVAVPGMPIDLDPVFQGAGSVTLQWKAPVSETGGPVRTYIVERREDSGSGFSSWIVVATTFNTEITLDDQTRSIQLEYHIKASNVTGESLPSNTAAVVL